MKAVVCTKHGPPDVLEVKDVETPAPADNEVLIKVRAASVNSWDWDLQIGKPFFASLGGLLKPQFKILGADIAGCVESVGSRVTSLQPGDEVFGDISGCGWGGFAEYVCAAEDVLAIKPAGMTSEDAAATPQAGVLALQGLRDKGRLRPGRQVLINGGGAASGRSPYSPQNRTEPR